MNAAVTPNVEESQKLGDPRPVKIPSVNPYLAPSVVCSNRNCRRILKPVVVTDKGGELLLRYDDEWCNYSFYSSMIHAQGICKPIGQENKALPEVYERKR